MRWGCRGSVAVDTAPQLENAQHPKSPASEHSPIKQLAVAWPNNGLTDCVIIGDISVNAQFFPVCYRKDPLHDP